MCEMNLWTQGAYGLCLTEVGMLQYGMYRVEADAFADR